MKRAAKAFDVICATDKECRPTIQLQELIQPVVFSDRMRNSDLMFLSLLVPVVEESIESNILLLANLECLPLFVVRIAISMGDALSNCDLLAQRLRDVFLRRGFEAHLLGNRSNFEHVAGMFDEMPKFDFQGIAR